MGNSTSNKHTLRSWFTKTEIRAYFGSRSDDERAQIVRMMLEMTPYERGRFKRKLADASREAEVAGRRN